MTAAAPDDVPERIGPFHVGRKLGAGGMGVVFEARDPRLERKVALKLVRGANSHQPSARKRIIKEAKGLASVSHPHVVQVFESDVHEAQVYVAMEFLSGGTLKQWLHAAPRAWDEIVRVFVEAGEGLAAAHARGLVHRDFKPDNVIFHADGRAKVTDFGLVGRADPMERRATVELPLRDHDRVEMFMSSEGFDMTAPITRTGALMGTPAFMAPEQFLGEKVGPPADQWAFCVALYWALFDEHPFASPSVAALATTLADPSLVAPSPSGTARRRMPARIVRAIQRGLQADPAARHPTMRALLDELVVDAPWARGMIWWHRKSAALRERVDARWRVARPLVRRMFVACALAGSMTIAGDAVEQVVEDPFVSKSRAHHERGYAAYRNDDFMIAVRELSEGRTFALQIDDDTIRMRAVRAFDSNIQKILIQLIDQDPTNASKLAEMIEQVGLSTTDFTDLYEPD